LYCGKDKNELIKRDKFTNKYWQNKYKML
jgi:hypothetical protein